MKKIAMFAMFIALMATANPTFAWGVSDTQMKNSGFSPEVIRVVDLQRSRMEDMVPIPQERSRWAQFWWNVYHNDPIDSTYVFGHEVLKY